MATAAFATSTRDVMVTILHSHKSQPICGCVFISCWSSFFFNHSSQISRRCCIVSEPEPFTCAQSEWVNRKRKRNWPQCWAPRSATFCCRVRRSWTRIHPSRSRRLLPFLRRHRPCWSRSSPADGAFSRWACLWRWATLLDGWREDQSRWNSQLKRRNSVFIMRNDSVILHERQHPLKIYLQRENAKSNAHIDFPFIRCKWTASNIKAQFRFILLVTVTFQCWRSSFPWQHWNYNNTTSP